MIITVGGAQGSGKGAVSRILAQRLGYEYTSMGDIWGAKAMELGMSLNEFHEHLHLHPEDDRELDERQRALGERDDLVIDSRLGFHFVPHAFKVYLSVEPTEGAKRVYAATRADEHYTSLEETEHELATRRAHESEQHLTLYGIDSHEMRNFDLVVDTTEITPEEAAELIIARMREPTVAA